MQQDDKTLFKTIDDMIVGVKYGSKFNYIYKNDNNNIIINYYIREYWYDHRHTERIFYEFEIDRDKTLLKLNCLKMYSDDLYGYLPLSTLEYNKNNKNNTVYLFTYYFEDNKFNIKFIEKEKKECEEYIKKCIEQTLKFVGKIDLTRIDNDNRKRRRTE